MRIERLGMTIRGREVVLGLPQRLSVFVGQNELTRWRFIELLAGAMLGQEAPVRALTVGLTNKQTVVIHNMQDSPLNNSHLSSAQLQRLMRMDGAHFGLVTQPAPTHARRVDAETVLLETSTNIVPAEALQDTEAAVEQRIAADKELGRLRSELDLLDESLQEAWNAIDRSIALQLEIDALNERLAIAERNAPRRLWAEAWFERERLLMALGAIERSEADISKDERIVALGEEVWQLVQVWREANATRRAAQALASSLRRSADETPAANQGAFTRDTRSLIEHLASLEQNALWATASKADRCASEFEALIERLSEEPELALSMLPDLADSHHKALREFQDIAGPLEPSRCLKFMGVAKSVAAAHAEATNYNATQSETTMRVELVETLGDIAEEFELPQIAMLNDPFMDPSEEATELNRLLENFVREVRNARSRLETATDSDHVSVQASIALADARVEDLGRPEWNTAPTIAETTEPELSSFRSSIARATCELQTFPLRSELNEMAERRDSVLNQIAQRKSALRSMALVSSGSAMAGASSPTSASGSSRWLTMRAPMEGANAWNEYLRADHANEMGDLADLAPQTVATSEPPQVDGTLFAKIRTALFDADDAGNVEVGRRGRRTNLALPVILNDPFADLDSATKRVVFDWIRTGPINRQVILLTNDPEIAEWARAETIAISTEVPNRDTAPQSKRVFTINN